MSRLLHHDDDLAPDSPLGGKAAALAKLGAAGLPVPGWLVVPPGDGPVSPEPAAELAAAAPRLAPSATGFAVRSSARDEDGDAHSFAGLLESFLFVPPAGIAGRFEAVRRSGAGDRVQAHRRERGLSGPAPAPAVLVQPMIEAVAAGVAFSADPVSGRRGHAVVSAVLGLGTALVSGEADADTFTVDRRGAIVARVIVRKAVAHRAAPGAAGGVQAVPVADGPASHPALTDAQVAAVAALARAAERLCGRPQDIEWALAEDGRIRLLQSRPITSLAGLADPDGVLNLWDNANIAESYSGVTTPLTFSSRAASTRRCTGSSPF